MAILAVQKKIIMPHDVRSIIIIVNLNLIISNNFCGVIFEVLSPKHLTLAIKTAGGQKISEKNAGHLRDHP